MVADALAPCVARSSAPMILCKMGKSLSSIRSDFNYLCHISMEKWYCKYTSMILLKNLACKVLLISVPIDIMAHDDSMASAGTMLIENLDMFFFSSFSGYHWSFDCQLDGPCGFSGDHWQMFQCFNVFTDIYKVFLVLFHYCILLEIKLTTKTMTAAGTATTTTSTTITTTTTNCKMMSVITNRSGFTKFGGTLSVEILLHLTPSAKPTTDWLVIEKM